VTEFRGIAACALSYSSPAAARRRDDERAEQLTALDVKGNEIPGVGSPPRGNQHDALTGSDSQGRAFTDDIDHTCNNWTSDGMTLR
jgi:hypothetical protein